MRLYESVLTIKGNLINEENPQPFFSSKENNIKCRHDSSLGEEELMGYGVACKQRTLPYRMQDRYTRSQEMISLKTIVMENEYLKAVFLPEYGGKLWSLFSKEENRELLFENPVFRPANLANRNAWTSGGIEWNLGHTGHFAFTCDNLYCVKVQSGDGENFLRMYEYEATHAQIFQLDFHLPDGAKQLGVHVRIENARNYDSPLYWWTNTAVILTPHTRVFSGTADIIYQLTSDAEHKEPGFGLCKMPEQPNLEGVDLSYPWRIPYSIEYFFQNKRDNQSPWEVSIEADCKGFMERSTQPLYTRKMFCWGNSVGGRHWCDYLSTQGKGDYIEIQAGLAPTQLHTSVIPANGVVNFTQVFGSFHAPFQAQSEDWNTALPFVESQVETTISTENILALDKEYQEKATILGGEMIHMGGYYGTFEKERRVKEGEAPLASHLLFPLPDENSPYYVWLSILNNKPLDDKVELVPYLIDELWLPIMEKYIKDNVNNEQIVFQYGVSLAENGHQEAAEDIFTSLMKEKKNVWSIHALGSLAKREENYEKASELFLQAYELENNSIDCSFAEDTIEAFLKNKDYEKAWNLFDSIPSEKRTEIEMLMVSEAAVKLEKWEFLEESFEKDYASIREGAVGLAEVWIEYVARLKAREKRIPFTEDMIDRTIELPQRLNFRMFDK